jgi:hypothetical protein
MAPTTPVDYPRLHMSLMQWGLPHSGAAQLLNGHPILRPHRSASPAGDGCSDPSQQRWIAGIGRWLEGPCQTSIGWPIRSLKL